MTTAAAKPTLLLVDDEERILRSLAMMFRPHFRVLATTEPRLAIDCVRRERVNVIVSDQRMPQMLGAELLREIRAISPNTMRILLTGYSELDAVVASVNEGEIFRFVNKPWDVQDLRTSVQQAASIAEGLFAAHLNPHVPETSAAAILVIDADPSVTLAVRELAPPSRRIIGTTSIEAALEELARQEIGVIVSELQVGSQSVVPLLKVLKAQHPQVVTLVMTPFRDINVLVGLINQGQVFRFLPKPLRRNLLSTSLVAAMARHSAMVATPALRAAHQVESIKEASEVSMASRISAFMARLRGRISPGLEPGRA